MENLKEKNIQRQSNFEILRIIAMIMIIFHHIAVHSNFSDPIMTVSLYIKFIQMGGKIGVNIFVLITGYFLINTEKIKINKILKLWGQMFFYALLIYGIFIMSELKEFEIKAFIETLFPIINDTWWFASVYFLLYIISPFLNIVLKNIDRNTYQKMICFMLVVWCIMPTFKYGGNQFCSLIWFIVLYCISGYIRLYSENWKISNKNCFALSVLIAIITYCLVASSYFNSDLFAMQSLPIFLISFLLFLGFKKTDIKNCFFINKIASTTFGIYLIHDNSYIRSFLWIDFFKVNSFENSNFLIPYSIYICFIVFFTCTIIDLIRQYTIEKYYMKFISTIETKREKNRNNKV